MVIGEKFAWTHMGKLAGDSTYYLFTVFSEHFSRLDRPGQMFKHWPFSKRPEETEGKDLALNIRRLPCFILSQVIHHHVKPKKDAYLNPDSSFRGHFGHYGEKVENRLAVLPDGVLNVYTDYGKLPIKHWLRTEFLRKDFVKFIANYYDITPEKHEKIFTVMGKGGHRYNHNIFDFFTKDEIKKMYDNNPFWTNIEEKMYGNFVHDMEPEEFLEHISGSFPRRYGIDPDHFSVPI